MTLQQAARLHIRRGMDVFSAYQNEFIGSVVHVQHSGDPGPSGAGDSGSESAPPSATLVHEEGHTVGSTENMGTRRSGEEMGPAPTVAAGNTGPAHQDAAHRYATGRSDTLSDVVWFAVRPGRLNLGPLTRPLYVPVTSVHSISMERVVLAVQKGQLPKQWGKRPD